MTNGNNPPSITPHGFFGNSPSNIFHSADLVSSEEMKILMNTARKEDIWNNTLKDSVWNNRVVDTLKLMNQEVESYNIIKDIQKRFHRQIMNFYNVEVMKPQPMMCRWRVGDSQSPHVDKTHFPHYDIGSVIYLNDDYVGGSIYFPQHDIEISPKAGDAYAFPGDDFYEHGVREITDGVRYTLPIFWTVTKHL